jgi:hypothetical protein
MKTTQNFTNLSFLTRFVLIAFLLVPWLVITAQDFTKTYKEKYEVDKGASLLIKNKFGDIKCQAWDESSVSIIVTVGVDAPSQEKANKIFDKVDVELTGSRTKVTGITSVDNVNNANFSITYEIRMPRWITIDLNNQFGDIYLDEADGVVKINLEYGAMEANAFNGPKTELTIKFSDVEAGFMKDGTLNIEYSEWESKGGENLKLISRFSEVSIEKMDIVNIDSQYDDVYFGSAGQVIAISRFSDLEFEKISGDFDFDIEYGNLDVDYISAAFKQGKVRNSFAGASLTFDLKASMNIAAEIEFGELSYPKANASMNEETVGYTTHIYKGRIGTVTGTPSQLTIEAKNADVNLDFED